MGLYVFSTLPIIYRSLGKEGKGQKKRKKKEICDKPILNWKD